MLDRHALALPRLLIVVVGFATAGCVPKGDGPDNGSGGVRGGGSGGGAAGSGGAPATVSDAGADRDPAMGDSGPPVEGCVRSPAPLRASGAVIELPFEVLLGGRPLVFGEPNVTAGGATVTPLNLRFYVSRVALLRASGDPVPVDLVTAGGVPAPYGVHLYNAEDVGSTTMRVLAPAGAYTGLRFVWGVHLACNTGLAQGRSAPLSPTSGMTWPHTGYLFLRYEGSVVGGGQGGSTGAGAGGPPPSSIHMGGNLHMELAPVVALSGALTVPAPGSTAVPLRKNIRVVMDQIFAGATANVDLMGFVAPPGPVGDEILAGERLRRSLGALDIFRFGP